MSSTGWPNNLTFVDDLDPRIRYSAGWQVVTGGAEVERTKHGADKAGMTATFNFTGTFVTVVGSLGSVDVYGVPTTTYVLDGNLADTHTYTAPVLAPGAFRLNQTFFSSPTLDAGPHTLVITNVNGTSPNVVWLDYVLYAETAASAAPSQGSTIPSTSGAVSVSASVQPSGSMPAGGSHASNTGAIVGGVVGGVAGLALLGGLLLWLLVRRRRCAHGTDNDGSTASTDVQVHPFDAWTLTKPPHCSTLLPAFDGSSSLSTPPVRRDAMTESSAGPGSVLLWSAQPDGAYQHSDLTPASTVGISKDANASESTAGLVSGTLSDGSDVEPASAPPPYML